MTDATDATDATDQSAVDVAAPTTASPTPVGEPSSGGGRWARLGRGWVRLWDEREPATAIAVIRILMSAALLHDLLTIAHLDLIDIIYGDADRWQLGQRMLGSNSLAYTLFGHNPAAVIKTFWITVGAVFLFGIGALTRVSGIVALIGLRTLALLYIQGDRGIDMMLRIILVILILSRSHETLSVDARIRHGRWARPNVLVPAWPRYLILLQVLWMYFSAGINKTAGVWWWHGDYMALHHVLRYPHFLRWDMSWVPAWVSQIGAVVTMLFELGTPLVLVAAWRRRKRESRGWKWFTWIWVVTAFSFHILLTVVMNIGLFTIGMMSLYPVFASLRALRAVPWPALQFTADPLPQEAPAP